MLPETLPGTAFQQSPVNQLALVMFLVSPLVALAAGYVGREVSERAFRSS